MMFLPPPMIGLDLKQRILSFYLCDMKNELEEESLTFMLKI